MGMRAVMSATARAWRDLTRPVGGRPLRSQRCDVWHRLLKRTYYFVCVLNISRVHILTYKPAAQKIRFHNTGSAATCPAGNRHTALARRGWHRRPSCGSTQHTDLLDAVVHLV